MRYGVSASARPFLSRAVVSITTVYTMSSTPQLLNFPEDTITYVSESDAVLSAENICSYLPMSTKLEKT